MTNVTEAKPSSRSDHTCVYNSIIEKGDAEWTMGCKCGNVRTVKAPRLQTESVQKPLLME